MKDYAKLSRQDLIKEFVQNERKNKESGWWWAIGAAWMITLFMLAAKVDPAVFTHLRTYLVG